MTEASYIVDRRDRNDFRLNRKTLIDPEILNIERERVFDKSWIYAGHESEVIKPGDFLTRSVAGRPVILARDSSGGIRLFLNTCRHRGARVCRERSGNTKRFYCFYHGWSYNNDGELVAVPGADAYPDTFDRSEFGLTEVPRFESYRGFWFACFDNKIENLQTYLAGAKDYIDLVVEQSPEGKMEVVSGVQEYDIKANWKLLVENSFDDYHLHSTHSTWLEYMKDAGVDTKVPKGLLLPKRGIGKDLGNGNAVIDNVNFRGRPVASWISIYGEGAKPAIEAARKELSARLGEERAERVANTNRNLFIFPNLMINDGSSVTIRTFWPIAPDQMEVTAWALGPVEESPVMRKVRLDSFLTFYGPGGLATPDDVEALEQVQQGVASTVKEVPWSVMTRGMAKEGEQLNSDELHLRTFWRQWNNLMTGKTSAVSETG
tara:strand:- start:813 stop:2111 length:1299 start_codon:yes stop_codon:yes gene_type:complete